MMKYFTIFLLAVLSIHRNTVAESNQTKSEKCQMKDQRTFGILPGMGWDNLMNREMGQIVNYRFSKCLYFMDNQNRIPNDISLTLTNNFHAEMKSEMFSHYKNYTSVTSYSINVASDAPFYGIGGSYSEERQNIKQDQIKKKAVINRIHIRYKYMQFLLEPDAELDPGFRNRILDIVAFIVKKKDTLYQEYLADQIIRDFGTHFIQTVDVGGVLSKIDFLKSDYVRKYELLKTQISTSALASFRKYFSIKVGDHNQVSEEELEEYDKNTVKTQTYTTDVKLHNSKFSFDDWINSVKNNLAPIDESGKPIYEVITNRSLPELDEKTIHAINNLLKDAVVRYYGENIRIGCMDYYSPNFNPDANVDSGLCKPPNLDFTLGGVFQTCNGHYYQCASVSQVNFLTGSYSCPDGFMEVLLYSGSNRCDRKCEQSCTFGIFCGTNCKDDCSDYNIYWCYPKGKGSNDKGLIFGDFISYLKPHCDTGYMNVYVGKSASMCVSTKKDTEIGIHFGGFYSCTVGNPFAQTSLSQKNSERPTIGNWPSSCPRGYASHLVNKEGYCGISYCMITNNKSQPLKKPPFIKLNYNTKTVTSFLVNGHIFVKSIDGVWFIQKMYCPSVVTISAVDGRKSLISTAGVWHVLTTYWHIGVIAGLIIIIIIITAAFFFYRRHNPRKSRLEEQYDQYEMQ